MKRTTPTIDATNIPLYKASMPMQTVFKTNADSCGLHVFEQTAREGNLAVYKRTSIKTGRVMGYETIKIKVVKAGTVFGEGATPTTQDTESYPGHESFGFTAWTYPTSETATAKFDALVKEATTVVPPTPTWNIPTGQFSVIDFAKANGLAVNVETAQTISGLLRDRSVKFLGKNEKAIQLFAKV